MEDPLQVANQRLGDKQPHTRKEREEGTLRIKGNKEREPWSRLLKMVVIQTISDGSERRIKENGGTMFFNGFHFG